MSAAGVDSAKRGICFAHNSLRLHKIVYNYLKVYPLIKRVIYNIAYPLFEAYWFIFRPKTKGVECVLIYKNKILMIRNTYAEGWAFPGGGVRKDELSSEAIRREVREELGIVLDKLFKLGLFYTEKEYKKDTVIVFYSELKKSDFLVDKSEILEAKWFSLDNLPQSITSSAREVIKLYQKFLQR